ncbi:conserved hypothetical protein [Solidesulfovibrio fructosivorans JJ]]|uniref:O-antigen ligase-related domain-containing protein n=1 Tax=Solidesulfovibrio fructosivorans JJ] TaxID=596151 RepID=E1JY10_SOLFR|nr:O-antigen ligase family protein [Solidesulfovibrio fructosivorans]EFL50748.1 conserved hypothetical protein [Solidesulfovibrio fructosivorans JJ]]
MIKRTCLILAAAAVGLLVAAGLYQVPWWASLSGLAVLALGVVSLLSPLYGLMATVFTLIISTANAYYLVVNTLQIHFYPYYIPLFCTCLGILAQAARHKQRLRVRTSFLPIILLIFCAEVLTVLWAPHFYWGVANVFRLSLNIALYYSVVLLVDTERKADILFKTIMASALMTSAGVIAATTYSYDLHHYFTTKFALELHFYTIRAGGIESWNQSAGLLTVASILAAGYAVLARTLGRRILWALAAMYFFCAMLLPASRGALLGFLGAAVLFLLVHPLTRRLFLKKTTLFVGVLVIGILVTTPEYIDRLMVGFGYTGELLFSKKKAASTSDSDATGLSTRFKIWKSGFRDMGDKPGTLVAGLGAGGFTYHVKVFEIHNLYLAFFFDMGIFGLFLLAFWAVVFFLRSRPVFDRYEAWLLRPPDGFRASRDFTCVMFFAALTTVVSELAIHGLVDYDLTSFVSRYAFLYLAAYDVALRLAEEQCGFLSAAGGLAALTGPGGEVAQAIAVERRDAA